MRLCREITLGSCSSGTGFNRYGTVDAGGQDRATGENVGQGDHFLQAVAAAALFGTLNVLNSDHQLTVSLGDMSSSNGSDPWQPGGRHHAGHGHDGNRSGLDIDFRYMNNNGVSFQSQTARSDAQFSVQNNQTVYDTARTFGFTTNYQGTNRGNNGDIQGVTRAGGHNDHGHLGFNQADANIFRRTMLVAPMNVAGPSGQRITQVRLRSNHMLRGLISTSLVFFAGLLYQLRNGEQRSLGKQFSSGEA